LFLKQNYTLERLSGWDALGMRGTCSGGFKLLVARRLLPLVKDGFAESLAEAATRFAISHPAMGTILVGMATPAAVR
jgi:hypothetical protein